MTTTTLPRLLRRNAETIGERPAIREKNRGIWQTYNWAEYCREVREFASGLAAHGFGRGDLLAVAGDNRPRLYWAQLAAQCLGGVAVPVYQDSIAAELVYVLGHRRRGPGAGRQDPRHQGAAASLEARRVRRSARPAALWHAVPQILRRGA